MKKSVEVIGLFIISIIFITNFCVASDYCVTAEVSDISPSSIGVDEEFTIGVNIENCGDKLPNYVSFELIEPPTDIEIKEPLFINISTLYYGNSERFIIYHMKTLKNAKPGSHVIKTRLYYGHEDSTITKDGEISFNIIGNEAELSIASVKIDPTIPRKGDTVELTLRIENTGDGTAKAVEIYVDHPFQGSKQSFIGALDSDEDGPAVLTFIADDYGEFELPVTISYKDDFGDNELKRKVNLTVLRKEINWFVIISFVVIIALAIWGFLNYSKLKRTKNKIIHQLLSENHKGEIERERRKRK